MIYGIFTGAYSDWECVGYFDDPEEAYQYCYLYNKEKCMESDWFGDEYYVLPIMRIKYEYNQKPELLYIYPINFINTDGTWKTSLYVDDIKAELLEDVPKNTVGKIEKYTRMSIVNTIIYLKKYDVDKAKKIAQDLFLC